MDLVSFILPFFGHLVPRSIVGAYKRSLASSSLRNAPCSVLRADFAVILQELGAYSQARQAAEVLFELIFI